MVSRRNRRPSKTRRQKQKQKGGGLVEGISFPQIGKLTGKFADTQIQGQKFRIEQTQLRPFVSWTQPPPEEYRTLICFDPDAKAKSWLHWLVANSQNSDPTNSEEFLNWEPPAPPSGTHTYYLALFSHTFPINTSPPKQRGYFDVKAYMNANGLSPLDAISFKVSAKTI